MDSSWVQILGQFIGTAVGSAVIVVPSMKHRKRQNKAMTHDIAVALTKQVRAIEEQVEILKTTVGIHTTRLNEVSKIEERVAGRIAGVEAALPKVESVIRQAMNFLDRAKAKPLETSPLPGGNTAIKPRKG